MVAPSFTLGIPPGTQERCAESPSTLSFRRALLVLLVFNVMDALFTLGWIEAGLALEANPLMDTALRYGAEVFLGSKLALVSLGCVILWRHAGLPLARLAAVPVLVLYSAVVGTHLGTALHHAMEQGVL